VFAVLPRGSCNAGSSCTWSKGLAPIAIDCFGLPEAGEGTPPDRGGIAATYQFER
jgi:hypothetical protein